MNSFDVNQRFEREMWEKYVGRFAKAPGAEVRTPFLQSGTARQFREIGYDFEIVRGDRVTRCELKCERAHTGNLFLETWSNKAFGKVTPGWMKTGKADQLWYFFEERFTLYVIDFRRLWEWCFDSPCHGGGNIYLYREVEQRRHEQLNRTCGHLVPIEVIEKQVGLSSYVLYRPAQREVLIPF